ncbi:MAG: ElyC/SanA/YdcF family protein [Candidatus Magasanikbacteria bacterium]
MRRLKIAFKIVLLGFFLGIGFVLRSQLVIDSYKNGIYYAVDQVPTTTIALVFGAGVKRDGTPSDALRDRVLTGVELYKAGKVKKILMTGDNGSNRYNEVIPMKKVATDEGVPEEDIVLDYAGFRTYDSCYRARDIFGVTTTIAISQEFHLPRILYICNSLGVQTVGIFADRQNYVDESIWAVREFLARFKAWYQVELTHPSPRYLGKKEHILL